MDIEKFKEEHKKMIASHGGYYAVNKRLLEQKVYISLYFGLKKGSETISFATSKRIIDLMYSVDLYTETGIKKFKIPPYSCFEIKDRLVTDSVFRVSRFAKSYKQKHHEAKIYLLYQDRGMLSEQVERETKRQRQVELFQIDDFLEKLKAKAKIDDDIKRVEQDWKSWRDQFIDNARYAYTKNPCTFFLGAGVSMDAGGPSWEKLLKKILHRFKHIEGKKDFDKIYNACGFSPIILGRYASSDDIEMKDIWVLAALCVVS